MSTGSVTPFTPTQDTQIATPAADTNSLMTFNQCDALMIWNSGAVPVMVRFATASSPYTATPAISAGMPIPGGTRTIVGVPGVIGVNSNPTNQVAILALASGAGAVYVTPGLGTEY